MLYLCVHMLYSVKGINTKQKLLSTHNFLAASHISGLSPYDTLHKNAEEAKHPKKTNLCKLNDKLNVNGL